MSDLLLIIVDGDNVAHRRGGDPARMRDDLITDVSNYAEQTGCDVAVVFDGHGRDIAVGRVRVRFAADESADTIIERMAHRSSLERPVTVVSSDTVLRHVAARGEVDAMSAREFADRLAAAPRPSTASQPRVRFQLGDALDPATRAAMERIRRGGGV
jgi:predicted RNA-binding protein with PIN domain